MVRGDLPGCDRPCRPRHCPPLHAGAPRLASSPKDDSMDRQPPPTVSSLDLTRYLGTWYEIARLPMRHEPADYTDITASYTRQTDGAIRVDNRARDGKGELKESVGEARVVDPAQPGRLEVTFLPEGLRWIPFTKGDYWILRVDRGLPHRPGGQPGLRVPVAAPPRARTGCRHARGLSAVRAVARLPARPTHPYAPHRPSHGLKRCAGRPALETRKPECSARVLFRKPGQQAWPIRFRRW